MFKRVGIIGVGFMGGSFSLAYKKRFPSSQIIGFARNDKSFYKLKRLKIVDEVFKDLKKVVDVDLVVLGLPVKKIEEYLLKIDPFLKKNTIVIDLGSTKKNIEREAKKLKYANNFVACHPLCGSEKSGAEFAQDNLYENNICVITSSPKRRSTQKIKKMWQALGMRVIFMSADFHDKVLAYLSHLPHLISFSLVKTVPSNFFSFNLRSFQDLTRIAKSNIYLWKEIFFANRKNIIKVLTHFINTLEDFKKILEKKDGKALEKLLKKINKKVLK